MHIETISPSSKVKISPSINFNNYISSYNQSKEIKKKEELSIDDFFEQYDTYGAEQNYNYSKIELLVESNKKDNYNINNKDNIITKGDKESFIKAFYNYYEDDIEEGIFTQKEVIDKANTRFNEILNNQVNEVGDGSISTIIEVLKNKYNGDYEKVLEALSKMTTINGEALEEYQREINLLTDKYGMTKVAAETLLNQIDEADCTYIATVNAIVDKFKDNPKLFEEKFGYPLYKEDGEPNFNELLIDLYIFENTQDDNSILYYDENNKVHISYLNEDGMLDLDNQVYINNGENDDEHIRSFLQSKDINTTTSFNENNINFIENEFKKGNKISLGIDIDEEIGEALPMKNLSIKEEDNIENLDGSHQVYVTEVNKDTITVSSWGEKYEIKKSDLEQLDFDITSINIEL